LITIVLDVSEVDQTIVPVAEDSKTVVSPSQSVVDPFTEIVGGVGAPGSDSEFETRLEAQPLLKSTEYPPAERPLIV
jgi:hypothetical protein